MDNTQTLELQIKSTADGAVKSVKLLNSSLTDTKSTVDNVSKSINKMGKAFSMGGLYVGVKKLSTTFLKWMDLAVDRTEQLNLFNVVFKNMEKNGTKTFSTLGRQATQFQNKLNEAFGTNLTETTKYQGLFQSMGENVGIPDTYSALMSTTMTKLTYDLASLYNKQENMVAEALRAGVYAGQTKPLRSYGIDVTQTSMQPILDSLGITDRSVKQMSQAEKEILRYLATLRQAKVAMGDFANTIESPSNQLKVFKQQLAEAKIALSSLFIGTFSKILPYANAILMVIKEVAKAIGTMFGIKLSDYNTGIADSSDAFVDLGDSIDGATASAKELKRQTLGFDQINNINENKDSGGGSGSVSGGIDQRLLDAIYGYDNGMDKVRMKATEIRDRIMEWLGFTKEIDPLTGEISWKFQGFKVILKNIWNWFKKLSPEAKNLTILIAGLFTKKMLTTASNFVKVLGGTGLFKAIKNLLTPMKTLFNYVITGVGAYKNLSGGISTAITSWRAEMGIIDKTTGKLNGFTGVINASKVALQGMITASIGLYTIHESMESLNESGANLYNVLGLIGGSFTTIASGVQIGAIFGPMGAVIGGATGALISLVSAMMSYETEAEKFANSINETTEKTKEYLKSIDDQQIAIEEQLTANLTMTGIHQRLIEELEKIVDANGKVKDGYEDRANFILNELSSAYGTEYSITDGIINKYQEYIEKTKELIKQKEAEYLLEANRESYLNALQNEAKLYDTMISQKKNYNEAIEAQKEYEEKLRISWEKYQDSYYKQYGTYENFLDVLSKSEKGYKALIEATDDAKDTYDEATEKYKNNILLQEQYSNFQTAFMTGNLEEIEKAVDQYTDSYIKNGELITHSEEETTDRLVYNWGVRLKNYKDTNDERYQLLVDELNKESKKVDEITPELASKWGELAKVSKKSFLEHFGKLPEDVQKNIIDKMGEKGYKLSDELQKGINKINPTIKIKTDTSSANTTINNFVNKWKEKLNLNLSFTSSFKAEGGAFYGGSWHNIQQYANGGSPSHGSMFVAGEAGAELVGHINGRTEVLNQSQIASAIYSAVVSAMSQSGGQSIDVHVHSDEGVIVDRINQTTKQTGVCPINIPIN